MKKKVLSSRPFTLSEVFGFKTNKSPAYKIGDLIDLKDDWGPGLIKDFELDNDAEEWKYRIMFPKVNKDKWFYEIKMKYFHSINEMRVFNIRKNKKE